MWQQGNTVVVTSLAFSGINDRNRLNLGHTDGFPIINRHKDTSGRIWDLTIIPPLKLSQHYVCPSLPAYCTQASLFRYLFVLGSLLSVHSPITLHWALVSVWPTSSSASAQRGPVGPRERPPWQSASLRRWGVSQSVSQLTIPLCYHSSWPLFLLQVQEPPVYPPAKGPHAWGPAGAGERCQYWLLIRFLFFAHYLLPSRPALPKQGAGASWRESMVEYCKHMCVTYVWNGPGNVHILSASGLTVKAHMPLHKMQRVVRFYAVKQYLTRLKCTTMSFELLMKQF